jgi:hypothetical protein
MLPLFQAFADYWWTVPLVGMSLVVYRFVGWRGLLAVLSLGLAGGLWTEGRRHERNKAEQAAQRRHLEALESRKRVDDDVANLSPGDRRKRLDKWMRDDK